MSGTRRGVYLSVGEAAELERLSRDSGLTPSSVLRVALRTLAGMQVPREARELLLAMPAPFSPERDRRSVHLAR